MAREEHLRELEEKYENYTVYDNRGSKIGKVDDLFVDDTDHEEYIGVKTGFFGLKSTLIPTEIVRVNEQDRTIEVAESKDRVKDAPSFDDDEDITAEYEGRIRSHFGLDSLESSGRGSYSGAAAAGGATSPTQDRDTEHVSSEHASSEHASSEHTASEHASSEQASSEHGASDHETRTGDEGARTHGEDTGGEDTGGRETTGSTFETTGGTREETYRDEAATSDRETHEDAPAGEAGHTEERDRYEETGTTSGDQGTGTTGASEQEGSTTGQPSNTRQTEETETFQEGGRTKVRRRIVREEIIDADER